MPDTPVLDPLPIEILDDHVPMPAPPGSRRREQALVLLVVLMVAGVAPLALRAASGGGDAAPTAALQQFEPATVTTVAVPVAARRSTAAASGTPHGVAVAPAGVASGFDLRLTSQEGRFQAWAEPLPPGGTIYAPGGRTSSTIDVICTS